MGWDKISGQLGELLAYDARRRILPCNSQKYGSACVRSNSLAAQSAAGAKVHGRESLGRHQGWRSAFVLQKSGACVRLVESFNGHDLVGLFDRGEG